MSKNRIRVLVLSICLAALAPLATAGAITNGVVRLDFQVQGRILTLTSVGDAATPAAFPLKPADVWLIGLGNGAGLVELGPSTLTGGNLIVGFGTDSFSAVWTNARGGAMPAGETFNLTLNATIAPGSQVVEFTVHIDASHTSLPIHEVVAPRISLLDHGAPADQVLTMPWVGGWLVPNPISLFSGDLGLSSGRFPHPGHLSMQWFAYYDSSPADDAVCFLGTRDPLGYRKDLGVMKTTSGGMNSLLLDVKHYPEDNLNASSYTSPYPYVLGVLRGDWYDAARFYREWAVDQPFTAKRPMRTNVDFSEVIKNGDAFGRVDPFDCPIANPLPPCTCSITYANDQYWARDMQDLRTYFGIDSIPTHAYHWHDNAFDSDWGAWLPIRPEFLMYAPGVAAQGDAFAPYFLNVNITKGVPNYTNGLGLPGHAGQNVDMFSVMDENGAQAPSLSSSKCIGGVQTPQPTILTCLATDFAYDYTNLITRRLVTLTGARGVYLDVFTCQPSDLCYDPSHGHPIGGGSYYTQGKIELVQSLRDAMRMIDPEFYCYSECMNEYYLGVTELTYAHVTLGSFPIAPLFDTVYHDYQINGLPWLLYVPDQAVMGNTAASDLARQSHSAMMFYGLAPVAGGSVSPTTLAQNLSAHPAFAKFMEMYRDYHAVLKETKVRAHAVFGERLRDPSTNAERTSRPGLITPYGTDQPLVYVPAFKDPVAGSVALLFLNWSDTGEVLPANPSPATVTGGTKSITYTFDPADYGLTPGSYKLTEYAPTLPPAVATITLGGTPYTNSVTVPARSIRGLIFSPL